MEELKTLESQNTKILIILGYAIGLLGTLHLSISEEKKYQWIKDATENTIYLDKKWPMMP